jgi:hypothetical protein
MLRKKLLDQRGSSPDEHGHEPVRIRHEFLSQGGFMANQLSSPKPLTVYLPAELIAEIRSLAEARKLTVDEIVRDAYLTYRKPASVECPPRWSSYYGHAGNLWGGEDAQAFVNRLRDE